MCVKTRSGAGVAALFSTLTMMENASVSLTLLGRLAVIFVVGGGSNSQPGV